MRTTHWKRRAFWAGLALGIVAILAVNAMTLTSWPPSNSADFDYSFGWPFPAYFGKSTIFNGELSVINLLLSIAACVLFAYCAGLLGIAIKTFTSRPRQR